MTNPTVRRPVASTLATLLGAVLVAAGCGPSVAPRPRALGEGVASPLGSAWVNVGSCGNGTLDAGEACDDGNGLPGDGCTATCDVETDYTCTNAAPVALTNGGFNAQGASIPAATGTQITGWTVTAGNVDLVVPTEPQASWLLTAEGTGMVDLAGVASNGTLAQNFATTIGRNYTVHFAYAARCPSTAPCTRTFSAEAADVGTGATLTTAKFSGAGDPQPAWQVGTLFFKATGTSSQIRFLATDADTTNGALIDAVSIPASTCYLVPQLACMTPASALSDLSLNGVASVGATSILANPATGNQLGAAFSTRTFAPSSFSAVARLRTASASNPAADGFALVFQNDPRGPAAIGCPGEGLGYGQQPASGCTTVITPSVAVELDTFYNAAWDAGYPNPHIAIDANGSVAHASPAVMPSFPMVNATFTVWADYNLATRTMQVFGSAGTVKPATPLLVYTLTPAQAAVFDNPFYAGITGSTGGSWESQEILFFSISSTGIVDANGDGLDDRCNTCGNGLVDAAGEECDDGNTVSGDGCSATCKKEPGAFCTGVPSVCEPRCGDGIVSGAETCDDGNTTSGDGCSSTCQIEPGFVCSPPPATNTLITVDGTAQCAATGSSSTFNPTTLPAGRYGLFYEAGAVQVTATPTFQSSIEARASVDGATWTNTPIVSAAAATSAAAIGDAVGNRGFFTTNGSTTWFFFPDASCGNNAGTDAFRLRGVSLCQSIPDTTLTAKPASLSNLTGPSFSFTATVAGSTFLCSLDGAAFASCATPKLYAGLAQGAHTFTVEAVNGAAVDPTPASWSWTIDSVVAPPVISFPGAATQVPGNPTVAGTAEAGASVTVQEGATTLCTVAADSAGNWNCGTTLGAGNHTLGATQTDLATNVSGSATVTFNVATALPPIVLAAPAVIGSGNAAVYPVSGTCGPADGSVTVAVGAAFTTTSCTGGGTFGTSLDVTAVLDATSVTVTASQTNIIGTGTSSRLTRKDTVALPPTIAAPIASALVAANPSVSGLAEPGASVTVKNGASTLCTIVADGGGAWSCATALAEASYTLSATQVDVAGNASSAATVGFTVVAPPVVAITSGTTIFSGNAAAYPVTGACKTLAGAVTVKAGTVTTTATCTGSAFTATLNVASLGDGPSVTITATQSNPAGTGTDTRDVVKDTVALPPTIASPAAGGESPVNPTLSGSSEDFSVVTVKEGAVTVCTASADSNGNWSCTTTLGAGSHTLTSTQVDAAGNVSGAATRTFTVVVPPVVTLTAPGPINIANTASYPIAGTCTTGAGPVSISVGTLTPATTPCTAGAFGATFNTTGQADAVTVSVTATQTNGAGTGGDTKTTRKDTAAPAAPAIVYPTAAQTVSDTPEITGTAEAGATVVVKEGATTICSGGADGSGNWSCDAIGLAAGAHAITATQTDVAGNGGAASGARNFTVNIAFPDVTINSPVPPINVANVNNFVMGGTCTTAAGNVTIRVGGGATTQSVACTAGTFTTSLFNVSAVADGASIQVRAQQTLTGNTTQVSEYTLKDTAGPAAPVISVPAAAAQVPATSAISGTSENAATVTVSEGAATVCTATATSAGAWNCTVTLALGAHSITATQADIAGNGGASSGARAFTVVAPPVVTLTAPATINAANAAAYTVSGNCTTGAGNVTVSVGAITSTPTCTAGAFTTSLDVSGVVDASSVPVGASQTNVAGSSTDSKTTRKDTFAAPPTLVTPAAGATVPPSPAISGSGEPGVTVTVREGAATVCTATADGSGSWSCATILGLGAHSVTATQVDTAGNPSAASAARAFTCANPPVVALAAPAVIFSGNAAAYGTSGSCTTTAGDVSIAVGTVPATATCAAGAFAATLNVSSLADAASVTVTASQTNGVGTGTDSRTTRKDSAAPAAPAFTVPAAGAEVAANPSLSGTSEAGASVTVKNGAATVCSATADGSGNWSCATTLTIGSYSLTAMQTDTAGNPGAASVPRAFTVVGLPVVLLDAPGIIYSGNALSFPVTGTCTGTYPVDVMVGAIPAPTACAGGTFAVTPNVTSLLDSPSVTVTASQTDAAGTRTDTKTTRKDTVASPPAIDAPASGAEVASNPALSGTSEPGASVTVVEGGSPVCSATANGSGAWTCVTTLGVGTHTLTATQTDTAGNTSAPSADHLFSVVAAPTVALNAPGPINASNAAAYPVSGTCTTAAGSVTIDVGSSTANPFTTPCTANAFSRTVDTSGQGDSASVLVSAAQSNVAGTSTDSKTTRKDTVANPPAFTSPASGADVAANPSLTGTAEAGAGVTVKNGATTVCSATADGSGAWTCTTTLLAGTYALTATQIDTAGNTSAASPPLSFSVAGPAVVTLTAPAMIYSGNSAAYAVAGTCTTSASASAVGVTIGPTSGTAACTAGAFSTTLDVSTVPDGLAVRVSASQSTLGGPGAASTTVRKDSVAAAPVVLFPAAGEQVAPNPSLSGTAEPFATVAAVEGAAPVCSGAADASGNWSCATTLSIGLHAIDASQTDSAGNVSAPTSRSFTVATLPAVTLAPLAHINGSNVAAFPVAGGCTAAAGSVSVAVGTVMTTTTCTTGAFSATLDVTGLAESPGVTVSAAQTNVSGTGTALRTTPKDTVANPPAIASPAAGSRTAPGPTLAGAAEPFATVHVAEGATPVCAPTADAAGDWSCSTTLALGAHTVGASQTDPAGNVSAPATRTFTVVAVPVVTLDPLPPITAADAAVWAVVGLCDPAAGDVTVTAGTVAVAAPCAGSFTAMLDLSGLADAASVTVTASQTNASGTATDTRTVVKDTVALAPAILSPASGGTVAPSPAISGTAEAGSTIAVTEGAAPVCSATTDGLGHWSCATSAAAGPHTLTAVMTDAVGNVSPAASVSFTVAAVPVVSLDAPAVVQSANAAAYPVTGRCDASAGNVTVQVGTVVDPAVTCTVTGRFAATLDLSGILDAAVVTVSASQTNVTGTGTDSRATLKDTVALAPVFLSPTEGEHVATTTPTFGGTAEPGALVVVLADGVEVGRVTADGAGSWSVTAPTPLSAGAHSATATQLDAAGNTSPAATRNLEVDSGAPPTVDSPAEGTVVDFDRPILLAGSALPNERVAVYVDGNWVGDATADASGRWSLTLPPRSLPPGAHTATSTARGKSSVAQSFTVRMPKVELTGGGCGCAGAGGNGGNGGAGALLLALMLAAALRRRPRRDPRG